MKRRFHAAIMGMYRDATGEFHNPKRVGAMFSDDDIIYDNSLILPYNMIRLARMSLLCRIVKKRCSAVLDLIKIMPVREGSWCFSVFQDLQWVGSGDKFSLCRDFLLNNGLDSLKLIRRSTKQSKSIALPLGQMST